MNNIQKLFSNPKTVKLLIIIVSIAAVLSLPELTENFNRSMNGLAVKLAGEKQPNSGIVILSISREDIRRSRGWPLQRDIYTELINSLSALNVKKIGLGIFLSENGGQDTAQQAALTEAIEKSGRVILSSVFIKADRNDPLAEDTVVFSSPKTQNPQLRSGHLNFIQKNGIYLPSVLFLNNRAEESFAEELAGDSIVSGSGIVKVNVYTSWKRFGRIGLNEFLENARNNPGVLRWLNGKTVLIGTVDSPHAQMIRTEFDEELPGIGVQAIMLDNLLTGRMLNYRASAVSVVFSLLLLWIIVNTVKNRIAYIIYGAGLIIFFAASFAFRNVFFIECNFAVFLPGWIALLVYEIFRRVSRKASA